MASMARHDSVGAYSGFSVCQPALGASLQWLPAIGTAELNDMVNAFLPGPASINDKLAHIVMDFSEYCRQTGENFKFYPVPTRAIPSVTASPAASAFYDSGYASSLNHSPVLSEGSWTQSPASFIPAASDARVKSRPSAAKKASASSSRQQTVDFANHPGMRILTKDGRDVTNSASRGCKTKEQRDHAHLMRIIKACDSCKKKKVRCDPSHKKRAGSQASAVQAEQRPAKKPRKVEQAAPVAVLDATANPAPAQDAFGPETLSFPSFDPVDTELWNDFVTFDQELVAAAPPLDFDWFEFDYSTSNVQSFASPSSGSSATSPSQILTPATPAHTQTSPAIAADVVAADLERDFTVQDLAVPYLNPGVAHGTDYVDFNLYSPPAEAYDEDPVLQMIDLGSQQHSPLSVQSPAIATGHASTHNASSTGVGIARAPSTSGHSGVQNHSSTASPADVEWYYDPGDTGPQEPQPDTHHSQSMTSHNRLVETGVGGGRRAAVAQQVAGRSRRVDAVASPVLATSSVESPVLAAPAQTVSASSVFAHMAESSISPDMASGSWRMIAPSPSGSSSSSPGAQSGPLGSGSDVEALPRTVSVSRQSSQHTLVSASSATGDASSAVVVRCRKVCASSPAPKRPVAGGECKSLVRRDGEHVVPQQLITSAPAAAATVLSTLPMRCNVAGKAAAMSQTSPSFFQLAVFGLVSILCGSAILQTHPDSQGTLVNILFLTSISLARLVAPLCSAGLPPSATKVASAALPSSPPTPSESIDNFKSKAQTVTRKSLDFRSSVSRWARHVMPRLPPSVRTLRV